MPFDEKPREAELQRQIDALQKRVRELEEAVREIAKLLQAKGFRLRI